MANVLIILLFVQEDMVCDIELSKGPNKTVLRCGGIRFSREKDILSHLEVDK